MAISYARLAKQDYDRVTVALTGCTSCGVRAGARCRRQPYRESATPCWQRQNRRCDIVTWLTLIAWTVALKQAAELGRWLIESGDILTGPAS